jgi:hypothetical protein
VSSKKFLYFNIFTNYTDPTSWDRVKCTEDAGKEQFYAPLMIGAEGMIPISTHISCH